MLSYKGWENHISMYCLRAELAQWDRSLRSNILLAVIEAYDLFYTILMEARAFSIDRGLSYQLTDA